MNTTTSSHLGRAVVALAATVASACSGGGTERVSAALPPPPGIVEVDMKEYAFDYDASPIAPGRVVFRVRNVGRQPHRISLLPLAEDVPPIAEQIRGSRRRSVTPFAGMAPQRPGESASFAVTLAPGVRYAMICFINEGGRSHALEGMVSEFRTTGARPRPPATTAPAPTTTASTATTTTASTGD